MISRCRYPTKKGGPKRPSFCCGSCGCRWIEFFCHFHQWIRPPPEPYAHAIDNLLRFIFSISRWKLAVQFQVSKINRYLARVSPKFCKHPCAFRRNRSWYSLSLRAFNLIIISLIFLPFDNRISNWILILKPSAKAGMMAVLRPLNHLQRLKYVGGDVQGATPTAFCNLGYFKLDFLLWCKLFEKIFLNF